MNIKILKPKKALNKAYLKIKPHRSEIEDFKTHLITLFNSINENETEEFHKNLVIDFLKKSYYDTKYFINTKGRNDLVIHNGKTAKTSVGVIIEAKSPTNRYEMITTENLNRKAFQELVLYYLRERITHKNIEIKHLIVTNVYEWFIFDVQVFDRLFAQNRGLVKQFQDFEAGRLAETKTDFFYTEIASLFIDQIQAEIQFTHFDIRDFEKPLKNESQKDDIKLISLFKLLSPEHLLKLPFANDSNTLDKTFYSELLHIIGLTETTKGGRKLIERPEPKDRNTGTLLESTIIQLDSLDVVNRMQKASQYGKTTEERLFNVALELVITWINRILFLKLMEAQLIKYNNDTSYSFLNFKKIKNYDDLNSLFFQVLAKRTNERNEDVADDFMNVPYLNSSLFEPANIERNATIYISGLRDEIEIPIYNKTELKDKTGKKKTGKLTTLEYLFEFLDAYDFSSEGSEEIQEENKTLINASVLGLIFEKINGYKDGSFFTPGFVTMFMARESIRKAAIQKFNEIKAWNCSNIQELYNKIDDIKEANEIVNSIKICDPAVGSGHFLVSSLNEMIALKNDLRILQDRNGLRLKEYQVEVVNDELIVTDEDGELFEYHPTSRESQRVQETLFHEKQTIIESCLFGVDINPSSVKICRLRLWIELLKNAYYKSKTELETLPNIDINIKVGNSLISRFALDADIKNALKKSKWTIDSYRMSISAYHNAESKEQKHEMVRLIDEIKSDFRSEISMNDPKIKQLNRLSGELFMLTQQYSLFEMTANEKIVWNEKVEELTQKTKKLESEIEEIKRNKIYENAFEWRFEFPEVLNDDGDFVGFDVVIANPPYIRQEDIKELKPYLKNNYEIYHSIADLLTYFVELGYKVLKPQGIFKFIISNKFTRTDYGKVMRQFLLNKTRLTHFIDFSGIPVFDEATVDAAILSFVKEKATSASSFIYADVLKDELDVLDFENSVKTLSRQFSQKDLEEGTWAFEAPEVLAIKQKVEAQGIPLEDWNITINYGIKTGYNKAFIIDGAKRRELIEQDAKSDEIIKPLLRGRDIQKWQPDFQDLWLIATFPSRNYEIDNFTAIKEYLASFGKRLEQSGEKGSRKKTANKWFEIQDNIAYWQDFEKPKIIYPELTKFLNFYLDVDGSFYTNNKCFIFSSDNNIYWLNAFFNSKLWRFCFRDNFPELLGGTRELRKVFFEKIPVKILSENEEAPFKALVNQILSLKKSDSFADTSYLEFEIDQMVYELYGLTEEEIEIIESV